MNITDFLALLKGVKPGHNGEYMALCPGHHDTQPSLSIKEVDGKMLLHCHAGCELADILRPLNLEAKDLFLDSHKTKSTQDRRLVATFSYCDLGGKESYQIRRYEPKDFNAWHKEGSDYAPGMGGASAILYGLPELVKAVGAGETIYLPEGERKVDRLWQLGLAATTSPFGAGPKKWLSSYNQYLTGAKVVILADNDNLGKEFAEVKAVSLFGIASTVKILLLPGLPPKGDIVDWLDEGHTLDELKQLADVCPDYEPSDGAVKLRRMADIQAESVNWLWPPYIPKGKLTLEEGDPGIGKSWASLAIATAVTLGKGLPSQKPTEPANVVIASAEDGLGDTIRPRLDAMGADVSRIFAIDGALTLDETGFALLESYLERVRPVLLIIDPLVAYMGAGVDIFRANETRAVMAQLARLAEQFSVAILAVRHLTKGGQLKAIYRGLGSIDFTAACRSVLLAGCDPENPQNRALVHIKSNLAPEGPAIGYELREGGFYWKGESTLTKEQILAADTGAGASDLDEAIAFLRDELVDGSVPAKDVYRDAEGIGIARRTLERAKSRIGIKARRQGEKGKRGSGVWVWELPADLDRQDIPLTSESQSQNDLHRQHRLYKEIGDLNHNEAKKEVVMEGLGDLNTETALGMTVSEALEIWRSQGAPVIHLGPGENCLDLVKLLSNRNFKPEHLEAVKVWLEKVLKRRGE